MYNKENTGVPETLVFGIETSKLNRQIAMTFSINIHNSQRWFQMILVTPINHQAKSQANFRCYWVVFCLPRGDEWTDSPKRMLFTDYNLQKMVVSYRQIPLFKDFKFGQLFYISYLQCRDPAFRPW